MAEFPLKRPLVSRTSPEIANRLQN